jgi:hypothetical protein
MTRRPTCLDRYRGQCRGGRGRGARGFAPARPTAVPRVAGRHRATDGDEFGVRPPARTRQPPPPRTPAGRVGAGWAWGLLSRGPVSPVLRCPRKRGNSTHARSTPSPRAVRTAWKGRRRGGSCWDTLWSRNSSAMSRLGHSDGRVGGRPRVNGSLVPLIVRERGTHGFLTEVVRGRDRRPLRLNRNLFVSPRWLASRPDTIITGLRPGRCQSRGHRRQSRVSDGGRSAMGEVEDTMPAAALAAVPDPRRQGRLMPPRMMTARGSLPRVRPVRRLTRRPAPCGTPGPPSPRPPPPSPAT